MKALAHSLIYYFGVASIFLAIAAVLLSGIGVFYKYMGVSDFSAEIFQIAMIFFTSAVGIGTYINIFFLHKDLLDLKKKE